MTISLTSSINVLVVDDDQPVRELLQTYLAEFGMHCQTAADGHGLWQAVAAPERIQQPFSIIILDLMLPGEDGLSLCRKLRSQSNVPIMLLTARGESADRVLGLELGADDYMVKPFDPRELVARIHSILRRTEQVQANLALGEREDIKFGRWSLNRISRFLTSDEGLTVPLSNAEYRLLLVFIERPRRLLSRDQLLELARGRNAEPFDRSIDILISRLRQKLQDDPKSPQLLKTIRGEGYMFNVQAYV